MNNNREEERVRGYLKINRLNKNMLTILNLAILGAYLWGYTNIKETASLFFISLIINAIFLKMAVSHVKREAISTGYSATTSSIFEIMNKITVDLQRGSPVERMDFRKKNSVLCSRLDATGSMTIYLIVIAIFWIYFVVRAIVI